MITTNETLTLFGTEHEIRWSSEMQDGEVVFRAFIATEHGDLVATSSALWNAMARLTLLVEWMNEQGKQHK